MSIPNDIVIGIIGGSGVYKMDCLENPTSVKITTPYGDPSDEYCVATVGGVKCAFLPRHNRNHIYTPTEVNYRANMFGFKLLGCRYILAISACGSLQEKFQPGDLVLVDQLVDRTFARQTTMFGNGIVAHVPFGHPICDAMHEVALAAVTAALPGVKVHKQGTLVTMEGPVFSTKAESNINRQLGGDLIGMTTTTEAKLARECEMAFVCVSMVTDMDAWVDDNHVDVAKVMKVMHDNAAHAQTFTKAIIEAVGKQLPASAAHDALKVAIMTKKECIPPKRLEEMKPIIGRYFQ